MANLQKEVENYLSKNNVSYVSVGNIIQLFDTKATIKFDNDKNEFAITRIVAGVAIENVRQYDDNKLAIDSINNILGM